jgi:hypothetical protein
MPWSFADTGPCPDTRRKLRGLKTYVSRTSDNRRTPKKHWLTSPLLPLFLGEGEAMGKLINEYLRFIRRALNNAISPYQREGNKGDRIY